MSPAKRPLTESQFNKWRTLIALAHLDGQFCPLEESFIRERLSKRDVKDEQMQVFEADFAQSQPAQDFFCKIHELQDRAMLFYLARLIFFQDGQFCDLEKMFYEKFHGDHMSTLDLDEIRKQIQDIEQKIIDSDREEQSNKSLISKLIDQFF